MKRSKFTNRELQILSNNPYTFKATAGQIFFTKEFKEEFWKRYQLGDTPLEIIVKLGYDPDILGSSRITGIQINIKNQSTKPGGFTEGKGRRRMLNSSLDSVDANPSNETVVKMQHELLYLKQEMEFLKKILLIKNTDK